MDEVGMTVTRSFATDFKMGRRKLMVVNLSVMLRSRRQLSHMESSS